MELADVQPEEIVFQEKLFDSKFSFIFLVTVRGRTCVMKVHHGRGPRKYYEPEDRELNIHVLEATAYTRLKEQGLCERGIVPNFLGSIRKFDPSPYQPWLRKFTEDEYLPSAIFLDYIPNLETIQFQNCTPKRMDNFLSGIREIHRAYVLHEDPKPRNMKIVKDDPERVVWIDFDRAMTFDEQTITETQKWWLEEEEIMVSEFHEALLADYNKGELDEAAPFFRF